MAFLEPPQGRLDLRAIWNIEEAELGGLMQDSFRLINSAEGRIAQTSELVAWSSYALLELQDLQPMLIPKEGEFLNQNYLFFEALAALRESILCGLGGLFHASFAVLRSAVEQLIFHYWWREKLRDKDDYEPFYRWLRGDRKAPPFANAVRVLCRDKEHLLESTGRARIEAVYDVLCSYSHKPVLHESITALKGGNEAQVSPTAISYWLEVVGEVQQALLHLAVSVDPHALFPVDVYRKFGFNGPIGSCLDKYSFLALQKALGEETLRALQKYYEEDCRLRLEWFSGFPELSDEQILSLWDGEPIDDENRPFEERLLRRAVIHKGRVRAFGISFGYRGDPHWIERKEEEAIFTSVILVDDAGEEGNP